MRITPYVLCVVVCGCGCAVAQDAGRPESPGRACVELNRTVLAQVWGGQVKEAEASLNGALTAADRSPSCDWMILQNMAVVMSRSGRLEEAEKYAYRSVRVVESSYPPNDPALLRPLHTLSSVRIQLGMIAGAREAFQKMQRIPTTLPLDRALLHATAAALFQLEGHHGEAEVEYLTALAAWEESGRGKTADVAAVLNGLADLYIVDKRLADADLAINRALAIFAVAADVGLADRIRILNSQAVLYAREGQWRKAEDDLRAAISLADLEKGLSPIELEPLLDNYAHVLARNHQQRESRSVAARVAALQSAKLTNAIVDTSELLANSKSAGGK